MKRAVRIAGIGAVALAAIAFVAGARSVYDHRWNDFPRPVPTMAFDGVLDGDTIVERGRAVHVAGLDAPELGPWAKCWAEAALAGTAKESLEQALFEDRGWHLVGIAADAQGHLSGQILDRDGHDIADDMRVNGGSAMTRGRWDWCGENANLHDPLEGEKPPMGPSLWWPSGTVFDARAAD